MENKTNFYKNTTLLLSAVLFSIFLYFICDSLWHNPYDTPSPPETSSGETTNKAPVFSFENETQSSESSKSPVGSYFLSLRDNIKIQFSSGITKTFSYAISDEDYKKYHDIMDYLYAYPDTSEDALFEELSHVYNQPASELKSFIKNSMTDAIARDNGNTIDRSRISTDDVIRCAKKAISESLNNSYLVFPSSSSSWSVSYTGLRYLVRTKFAIRPDSFTEEVIIKLEFSDDFRQYTVFQLKFNGENVDSVSEKYEAITEAIESIYAPSTPVPPETTPEPSQSSSITSGMARALDAANDYLDVSAFSYEGLIRQLEYSNFTHDEAVYAVNHCKADWYEQALKSAAAYFDVSAFSYEGLIRQLEYERFSHEKAVYAADHCGADWYEQALKSAAAYFDVSSFSYEGLIRQLEYEHFSHEEAVYAADHCGADWYEQAVRSAESYLELLPMTRDSLISQLVYSGFTNDQASYAADQFDY